MLLKAEGAAMRYFRKSGESNWFCAVRPTSLELPSGAVTVLMGRSGSGKTTLLNMLAGLLRPDEGAVTFDGCDLYSLSDAARARLRGARIGVIPQGRSAVDTLTVWENLLLPAQLRAAPPPLAAAEAWLEALDIAGLKDAFPAELSGGEVRRMAIARALSQDAAVLLADEPTGDLDDISTRRVLEILQESARKRNAAVLLVTHESEALKFADRAFRMDAGTLRPFDP